MAGARRRWRAISRRSASRRGRSSCSSTRSSTTRTRWRFIRRSGTRSRSLDLPKLLVARYIEITRQSVFYLDPHVCMRCRYRSTELLWQCPHCHEWNTFVEERITPGDRHRSGNPGEPRRNTLVSRARRRFAWRSRAASRRASPTVWRDSPTLGAPTIDADQLARDRRWRPARRDSTPSSRASAPPSCARDGATRPRRARPRRLRRCRPRGAISKRSSIRVVYAAIRELVRAPDARRTPPRPSAIADIPLLYETGHEGDFDEVVVAGCEPEQQLARLMARDGLTEDDARRASRARCRSTTKRRAPTTSSTRRGLRGDESSDCRCLERAHRDGRVVR